MSLPKLLKKTKQGLVFQTGLEAVGGGPQASSTLPFSQQRQMQNQWCWAAVTVSISLFYSPGNLTQCSLVNAELGRVDCCLDGSSLPCNRPWTLDHPLMRTGKLSTTRASFASFPEVVGEINARHPLCCRIGWRLGGGHFVVIQGYSQGANGSWVSVADPFYGPSTYVYDVFRTNYRSSGGWTHSYFTQA